MKVLQFLLLVGSISGGEIFADDTKDKDENNGAKSVYVVNFNLMEGDPRGTLHEGTLKSRQQMSINVPLGGKGTGFSGWEVPVGGEPVQGGKTLNASVKSMENGQLEVRGTFEESEFDITEGAAPRNNALLVQSSRIHFAEAMTPGKTVRRVLRKDNVPLLDLLFGKSHELWIELTVERVVEPAK